MTPNPLSISQYATVREAATFFTVKGISAAPVIDHAGRPVGVVSLTDIVLHHNAEVECLQKGAETEASVELTLPSGEELADGFLLVSPDRTEVREIMTPGVFRVWTHTPARKVVADMLALKVHRLFVVDNTGILVGVISALDVLRQLRPGGNGG
jgi:CBS domain-containing protein